MEDPVGLLGKNRNQRRRPAWRGRAAPRQREDCTATNRIAKLGANGAGGGGQSPANGGSRWLRRKRCPITRHTEGVGERPGFDPPTDRSAVARYGDHRSLFFTFTRGTRTGEARTLVSPTPSVVDRGRRCRSTIAMRSPLFDSRRPV
jgi:hypothetical protein